MTDSFPVVEPDWSLGDLLAAADTDNPDVNTLRARPSAARSSESAAKSEWLPTLDFSAGWSGFSQQFTNDQFLVDQALGSAAEARLECDFFNTDLVNPGRPLLDCDDDIFVVTPEEQQQIRNANSVFPFDLTAQSFSARVILSLPLFTQFGRPLRVSRASAAADDAWEAVEARRLQVRTDVSQAFYALQTAHESIRIQGTNRVAAQEQLRLATERYRVGSGTFFELLDAQLAAQQAEADYINAVYGYHQSIASLEAAVGRPLR